MFTTEIGSDVKKAKLILEQGELVAIPTETVYGLAGNGLNPEAIGKIYAAKNRPQFNPLILHVAHVDQLEKWVKDNSNEMSGMGVYRSKFIPTGELLQKITELKAEEGEWISVDDKPENKTDKYLVIRDGNIEIEEFKKGIGHEGFWYNYFGITHYQPFV
jgi:hypothetical protein